MQTFYDLEDQFVTKILKRIN